MIWVFFGLFAIILIHGLKPFKVILSVMFDITKGIASSLFTGDNYRASLENILALIIIPGIAITSIITQATDLEDGLDILPKFYLLVAILAFLVIKNTSFFIRNIKEMLASGFFRTLLVIFVLIDIAAAMGVDHGLAMFFIFFQVIIINILKYGANNS